MHIMDVITILVAFCLFVQKNIIPTVKRATTLTDNCEPFTTGFQNIFDLNYLLSVLLFLSLLNWIDLTRYHSQSFS